MTGPLHGITVLEVGVFMAAPFATAQLADLGARVIKIESREARDPVRTTGPFIDGVSSTFLRLNRNKEAVELDLKSEAGRASFLRLAAAADVVVENLRPGAMRRLGLGPDELLAENPGLVYASASGWGQDGPLADQPGLDIMAQARSGLMSVTGDPGAGPAKVGVPVCDLTCGLYVALAVTAALRHRDRTGEGQHVDVSLLESGVSLAVWEAGRYFATGEPGERHGTAHQSQAPYQAVQSADGWVTVGAITPNTWAAFTKALGREDLYEDPRYESSTSRLELRGELIPEIERTTREHTTAELVATLTAAGVPCAPISDYTEVFTDDHLTRRGFFWDTEHPVAGQVRQLGSPMRFSRTPARRDTAGPDFGEHTEKVLAEFAPAPIADPGDDLLVELEDDVLTVTFNRPESRNALTFAMYEGLYAACERADADPAVRVLVLRGTGDKAFVAGTDIRQFTEFRTGQDGIDYEASIGRVVDRLEAIRKPTVAVVRGACTGGGLALAAACDLRVADTGARFGVPIARTLGNCLSANTISLLVGHVGPGPTLDLLLRGRLLDATAARDAGLLTELAPPEELDEALQRVLTDLRRNAPLTQWASKEIVRRMRRRLLVPDDDVVARVWGSEDFANGVRSFVAGEKPTWTGR
ncbi:enoyl-CoA hydratase [Amycolatopsis sp. YIM 10]|uniref:enoyl-CoA hydratase n=1 Tax=Amycolatopsis sp. YIM 10 TaxID=2653857 RepID=UPI00128FD8BD|nr:enoyl-CoA hydratase [Amycolatopsis sp. YIM 10]QFU90508.1 Succinyl-CoA:(R)-benzylsuccinate CoA-transferase subunit BbsF [Amycolatopsis sp. YIM 10]